VSAALSFEQMKTIRVVSAVVTCFVAALFTSLLAPASGVVLPR
jgi:hypothetical protein